MQMSEWDQLYWTFRLNRDNRKDSTLSSFKKPEELQRSKEMALKYSKLKNQQNREHINDMEKKVYLQKCANVSKPSFEQKKNKCHS